MEFLIAAPIVIKGIQQIFATAAGALCVVLGYKLYVKGVFDRGALNAEGAGVKLGIKDYGPGVVMAAFGAAIIIVASSKSMSASTFSDGTFRSTAAGQNLAQQRLNAVRAENAADAAAAAANAAASASAAADAAASAGEAAAASAPESEAVSEEYATPEH